MLEEEGWRVLSCVLNHNKSFTSQVSFSITVHQCATYFSKPLLNVPCIFRTRRQAESLKWSGVARYGWGGCWFNKSRLYFPNFLHHHFHGDVSKEEWGMCNCEWKCSSFRTAHTSYLTTRTPWLPNLARGAPLLSARFLWPHDRRRRRPRGRSLEIFVLNKSLNNMSCSLCVWETFMLNGLKCVCPLAWNDSTKDFRPFLEWDEMSLLSPACHLAFPSPSLHPPSRSPSTLQEINSHEGRAQVGSLIRWHINFFLTGLATSAIKKGNSSNSLLTFCTLDSHNSSV